MSSNIGFTNGVLSSFVEMGQSVHRLGFKYDSSVFSIVGANGQDLSDNNPGYVCIASKSNPGQYLNFRLNSSPSFEDATGTSTITGQTFGVTSGVAWTNAMPFFVYFVLNDNEDALQVMISRNPSARSSPLASSIGTPSAPVTVNEADFFSFSDVTVSEYDQNPCVYVGCFRMAKATTAVDWTVQALGNNDGVNKDFDGASFLFPQGQNGAASGSWFSDGGGGAAISIGGSYVYKIFRDGSCFFNFAGSSPVTTSAATGQLRFHIPYGLGLGNNIAPPGHFAFLQAGTSNYLNYLGWRISGSSVKYMFFIANGASAALASNFLASGDTEFSACFRYPTIYGL